MLEYLEQPFAGKKSSENEASEKIRVENFEIRELVPALENLARQLKPEIEKGTYDALISDEVGGRLPTLILRKVFQEKGGEDLRTFFVAAGRQGIDVEAIKKFVDKNKLQKAKRALVVTEFIATGDSILQLSKNLESMGVMNFDVAVVMSTKSANRLLQFESDLGHTIFCGQLVEKTPELYESSHILGGVEKVKKVDPDPDGDYFEVIEGAHPKKLKDVLPSKSPKEAIRNKELLETSREDVKTVAEYLIREVWKE